MLSDLIQSLEEAAKTVEQKKQVADDAAEALKVADADYKDALTKARAIRSEVQTTLNSVLSLDPPSPRVRAS